MTDEDAILKRIIKAYLHQKGKSTAQEIAIYIQEVGFGLKKQYTKEAITKKIKYWRSNEPHWLSIRWERNERSILVFYLRGVKQ